MNYIQKTFWDMVKDCISFGRKNQAVWIATVEIDGTFIELETTEKEIDAAVKDQGSSNPSAASTNAHQVKENLGKRFYMLENKLSYYARKNNLAALLLEVDTSETDLLTATDETFAVDCNIILERGRQYQVQLASQGVTVAMLDQLEKDLKAFQKMPTDTNMVTTDQKKATRSIAELITEARGLLLQLDSAFKGNVQDENFLEEWAVVRKIKGRHNPPPPPPTPPKA